MTTDKDFKRLVRGRMKKTGESYTAARARLLARAPARPKRDAAAALPRTSYAELAGYSEASIVEKTGCSWEKWVHALDYKKAYEWPHGKIARYVHETFDVSGWWSQAVAVGYERIKGLRAIGQRADGAFEASKSRTFAVPVARLYRAFSDKRSRARWLAGVEHTVRSASSNKAMRMSWHDGSSVVVWFEAKGKAKSAVHIAHGKLADKPAVAGSKAFWTERLSALAELLA